MERDEFIFLMDRKQLSVRTQKEYLKYYERLQTLMLESGLGMCQGIADGFIDLCPNNVARAFLSCYLEFLNRRDIILTKITGRKAVKEQITIPESDLVKLKQGFYNKGEMYGVIFELCFTGALRRQEVLGIKPKDIDLSDGKNMFLLIRRGKGNKQRKVYIDDEVAIKVLNYLQNNPKKMDDYLFPSVTNKEKSFGEDYIDKIFLQISRKTTGKDYHMHQLRGTRATRWYDKGVDIHRISQRLGHSSIATTQIYIKPDARKELEEWSKEK